ncbi:hypothetical protein BT63DRAFT_177118 [Microthyrium microscopicum]|uniref:HTH La-type RNA-binding domain-containing protein n=1 Tax=Microthyrium microscopicum TaxID=703497 RepID=A0A6A6UIR2_9PEZI|nr:hypothetical protein BT63DRAFT_177118 [Microthyrium microscopicum]
MSPKQTENGDAQLPGVYFHPATAPDAEMTVKPHEKADEILKQVEFYFSNENLEHDEHLKILCGGSENRPVSLNEILGWKKMRQYRPKVEAIEALKQSKNLVVNDDDCKRPTIKRKDAWKPPKVAKRLDDDKQEIATFGKHKQMHEKKKENAAPIDPANQPLPEGYEMNRGVIKSTAGRTAPKASGFEAGHDEEKDAKENEEYERTAYHKDQPLFDRLQVAIYRYNKKRKWSGRMFELYCQFLTFGGVYQNLGNDQGGVSAQYQKEMLKTFKDQKNAADIWAAEADQLSRFSLADRAHDKEAYQVDFLGVLKSFIGAKLMRATELETQLAFCKILVNWYNYFLVHKVCEEFKSELEEAKELVEEQAPKELRIADELYALLRKSYFNKACKLLVIDVKNSNYGSKAWNNSLEKNMDRARQVVSHAMICLGDSKLKALASGSHNIEDAFEPIQTVRGSFKIVEIIKPTQKTKDHYTKNKGEYYGDPVGLLRCEVFEDCNEMYDLADGMHVASFPKKFTLWAEEAVLNKALVNMTVTADLMELSCASVAKIWAIVDIHHVYPTFYEPTYNELIPEKPKGVRLRGGIFNEKEYQKRLDEAKKEKWVPRASRTGYTAKASSQNGTGQVARKILGEPGEEEKKESNASLKALAKGQVPKDDD